MVAAHTKRPAYAASSDEDARFSSRRRNVHHPNRGANGNRAAQSAG
jgi:hypothetical protein